MTVKELISALRKEDQDGVVYFATSELTTCNPIEHVIDLDRDQSLQNAWDYRQEHQLVSDHLILLVREL